MRILIILIITSFIFSCTPKKEENIDRLVVRLKQDPDRLNPLLHSSSYSREVYPYIMSMLGEVNPITMEYEPLLIRELPEPVLITVGENKGKYAYSFEILPEAAWSDGSPVTAYDYIFTMKLIFHKGMNLTGYKNLFNRIIDSYSIDTENPKKFSIISPNADKDELLFLCGVEVYPIKYYDPQNVMNKYSLEDLADEGQYDSLVASDSTLAAFALQFQEAKYSREVVEGAGPYRLTAWESDQYIRLEKKENYWGNQYPERIPLHAYPQEIIFQMVEDDVVAITQLSSGEMDVATLQSTTGERFIDLKNDELIASKYDFYTPQLSRYICIRLNNESPFLSDKRVRKAFAHLVDVDRLIEVLEGGVGSRVKSVVSPNRPYFNNDLDLIPQDFEKAKSLLTEAGWTDSNADGTLDKVVNGESLEMKMRLHTTTSALGQRVALDMKEAAEKVGIEIELISQNFRKVTRPQNLATGDFELVPMQTTHSPVENIYQTWHSSQIGGKGINYSRYSNPKMDALLEKLQTEKNETEKNKLYKEVQQIIYDDYAILMLYAPVEKILVSKKYDPLVTSRAPGFLVNAFKPVK